MIMKDGFVGILSNHQHGTIIVIINIKNIFNKDLSV